MEEDELGISVDGYRGHLLVLVRTIVVCSIPHDHAPCNCEDTV